MNSILVSILVPIYGVEKYIERCAISLFEQTYFNIEYIFVDDCTPDNSISILKEVLARYPHRIKQAKIIRHEKNAGLANARITAIKNCTGKYLLNVDSDDYIEKDMVRIMLEKAIETDSDMVICDFNNIYSNRIQRMNNYFPSNRIEYISNMLMRKTSVCVCGRLIKTSLYTEHNVYPIPGLNYAEDYAVTPRLVYFAHNISKVDFAFYNYIQINDASYTKSLSSTSIDNAIQANDILTNFFSEHEINEELPLKEAKAVTIVTLLYSTPKQLLPKIIGQCKSLDIKNLKVSLLHKFILYIAKRGNKSILFQLIKFINYLRGIR